MSFFRLRTWNLDFDLRWGLHSHQKKNMMHSHIKNRSKGLFLQTTEIWISISIVRIHVDSLTQDLYQDIKLVLKGFELLIIWGKPFCLQPPLAPPPHPEIVVLFCFVFLLALSHFLTNFFKEMYQITQEDILLQIRHVPNVFETSPFLMVHGLLVETVKPFGCTKQFCDMQLAVDYILLCKLEIVSITRQIFIFKWN